MSSFADISVTIRQSGPGDAARVRRLAALDSAPVPHGPVLLAEVDGRLLAALSVIDRRAIADPFTETATLVAMLRAAGPSVADHRPHPRRRPRAGSGLAMGAGR
ncbi:MAG: hypothetical protein QOE27_2377 [Solirubrobacteraceae bacterium]|jgi:hypothetical protein|nr:hypothetical protein [Solirubrobacteraceae bacterium]